MILYYRLLGRSSIVGGLASRACADLHGRSRSCRRRRDWRCRWPVSPAHRRRSASPSTRYVVFFERLKDEVRAGSFAAQRRAQRGFAGAWHTIVVADIVSLLGAAVLLCLTVGSVKGFAFFLGLSTLCDSGRRLLLHPAGGVAAGSQTSGCRAQGDGHRGLDSDGAAS